ncbi:MAG: N-acetylmuramoyl-L-alanine amidase, partial [Phycisphaerae bacterium]|nr:N-acetylmuramoyl-L-alanine amidase [Phycisphaerae bacterium]
MRRCRTNLLCTLVLLIGAAGCEPLALQPGSGAEAASDNTPSPSVSVEYLAGRLDLEVIRSNSSLARLGNATNRVLIFSDPGGSVQVNGVRLSSAGAIERRGDMLFVPSSLVGAIRRELRPLPPKAATTSASASVSAPSFAGLAWAVVVLDAGHGGKDPGAISRTGHYEKHVAFSVTRQVAET